MKPSLVSVPIGAASFCRPSRGPTSTTLTLTLSFEDEGEGTTVMQPTLVEHDQLGARLHLLANAHADRLDNARVRRLDDMLHLHRLQHHKWLILTHLVAE